MHSYMDTNRIKNGQSVSYLAPLGVRRWLFSLTVVTLLNGHVYEPNKGYEHVYANDGRKKRAGKERRAV